MDILRKKIGWIGSGIMGASMCGHLLEAGCTVFLNTRTRSKAEPLLEKGAIWCDSPFELAQHSEIVFLMVGFPEEVREVVFGPRNESEEFAPKNCGVLDGLNQGEVLVDMSTNRPKLSIQIAKEAAVRGIQALDAPVSGGDLGAKNATLSIMIGGERKTADSLGPIWDLMGKTVEYHGPPGSGQHAKLANQILFASNMSGLCEALLYAYRAGLDLEKVIASTSQGAAGNWALSNLASRMVQGDFAPGFYVEHLTKDLGIVVEESRRLGIALPGISLIHQMYLALMNQGHARDGSQSLLLALAQLNNMELFPAF